MCLIYLFLPSGYDTDSTLVESHQNEKLRRELQSQVKETLTKVKGECPLTSGAVEVNTGTQFLFAYELHHSSLLCFH